MNHRLNSLTALGSIAIATFALPACNGSVDGPNNPGGTYHLVERECSHFEAVRDQPHLKLQIERDSFIGRQGIRFGEQIIGLVGALQSQQRSAPHCGNQRRSLLVARVQLNLEAVASACSYFLLNSCST